MTKKESFIKACGIGLSYLFISINVMNLLLGKKIIENKLWK